MLCHVSVSRCVARPVIRFCVTFRDTLWGVVLCVGWPGMFMVMSMSDQGDHKGDHTGVQGDHRGDRGHVHRGDQVATWSPGKSAAETGVSRSTIMRMLKQGKLAGAKKVNGRWEIPVTSLGAAGLRPGRPSPADGAGIQGGDHTGVQGDHRGDHEHVRPGDQGDQVDTLDLRHQLELAELRERSLRQELESQKALSAERAARIEDLQRALLMLERGHSDSAAEDAGEDAAVGDEKTPAGSATEVSDGAGEKTPTDASVAEHPQRQSFFKRVRGLFS